MARYNALKCVGREETYVSKTRIFNLALFGDFFMKFYVLMQLGLSLLAFNWLPSALVSADIIVDFDNEANWVAGSGGITSYQINHQYSESGFVFSGGPALRNGTALQDGVVGAIGSFSWRLRDAVEVNWIASYATVQTGNEIVSGFGIDVRRWDGAPSPNRNVEYSLDGGTNFLSAFSLNNTSLDGSSSWKSFTFNLPTATFVSNGSFLVRVSGIASGERIMLDNFRLSASAVPEPASLLLIGGIAAGGLALRRFRRKPDCSETVVA